MASGLLSEALQSENYRVLAANRFEEGFEILAAHKVGVVLMEQAMPDMDSIQFLAQVRKLYPDTLRIVLSC